jgi:hypothetical protein
MRRQRRTWHGRGSLWFVVSLLAGGLLGLQSVPVAGESPAPPEPVVVRADEAEVILEWRGPDFSVREVTGGDGQLYSAVEAPGWGQTEEPGQPQLPFAAALAVVPPTGDMSVQVEVLERARRPLPHPVVPARASVPVGSPPPRVEWTWRRDEHTYTGAKPWPVESVTLEESGWLRGHRLVRVTFYPLRFDPATGGLEVIHRVRVKLGFESQSFAGAENQAATERGWEQDDPFVSMLQNAVVNPVQVTRFVRAEQPAPAPAATLEADPQGHSLALPPANTDYLFITHSNFVDAVALLAAHRATVDGLHVFTARVEDIYAAYGGLEPDEAIKQYISAAYYQASPPALDYVLLVGDGVRDTQNHSLGLGTNQNFIPPYLILDPWGNKVASDNRFVTVDGSDNLADVFIGRLPVNTVAEATTVVEKILSYETDPPQWPWNQRVLFFAGNEGERQVEKYHQHSDEVYHDHLRDPFTGRQVYFCTSNTSDCNQPHLYTSITAAHDATMAALNGGGLLASYVGHSSIHQWAVDPVTLAPMFHLDDVAGLHNGGALPVVLEMTCYTSDFSDPTGNTLDEALLRQAGGGAVATWGTTTMADNLGHITLYQEFFDAVFQDGTTKLGQATEAAKTHLSPYYSYMRDTYVLLGDPAMDLNLTIVPWTHEVFLPATLRGR